MRGKKNKQKLVTGPLQYNFFYILADNALFEGFCAGETGATPTPTDEGESNGFTGDTAIERGTGEDTRGVVPVGVVLPLVFFCD